MVSLSLSSLSLSLSLLFIYISPLSFYHLSHISLSIYLSLTLSLSLFRRHTLYHLFCSPPLFLPFKRKFYLFLFFIIFPCCYYYIFFSSFLFSLSLNTLPEHIIFYPLQALFSKIFGGLDPVEGLWRPPDPTPPLLQLYLPFEHDHLIYGRWFLKCVAYLYDSRD